MSRPRRRFVRLVLLTSLVAAALFLWSSPSSSSSASSAVQAVIPVESVRDKLASLGLPALPNFEVPSGLRFSYLKSIHKPPEQSNSTRGDSKWYADWKWLNPFSSSVTLDEDRAVLPPLPDRPPVYTYYDTTEKRENEIAEADRQLLLIWRRAWWAKGFKPIVLTEAEAVSHPMYMTLKRQAIRADLEYEFMRWLAWAHMGTGLLASYKCVPMGPYDDKTLAHLRRGQFEQLTRFEGLDNGLFAGEKQQIEEALKFPLGDVKLGTYQSVVDAIEKDRFLVDKNPSGLAYYDNRTIETKYAALASALKDRPGSGRKALNGLIDAHLHGTWQNTFPAGINLLKPLPIHSTSLVQPAVDLAGLLAECPTSILQSSCPPNRPGCVPCIGSRMWLSQSQEFYNDTKTFTISVAPHPYTMVMLNKLASPKKNKGKDKDKAEDGADADADEDSTEITVKYIRRETDRDPWITAVTRRVLGNARDAASRVVMLKDMVASPWGSTHSIWFTTEQFPADFNRPPPEEKSPTNDARPIRETIQPFPESWLADLSWQFGFTIPTTAVWHGESAPPVPGPERWGEKEHQHLGHDGTGQKPTDSGPKSSIPPPPSAEQLAIEVKVLQDARSTSSKGKSDKTRKIKRVAEAWNLADAEAWKFIRAYRARADVEREMFEEEERRYEGTHGGGDSQGRRSKSGWW